MTPSELAADLRSRINPLYADQLGTESYERRLCAEAIEGLIAERDAEIETLKAEVDLYRSACDRRDAAIAAQRKVLEPVLFTLVDIDQNSDYWYVEKDITAIQEVLS